MSRRLTIILCLLVLASTSLPAQFEEPGGLGPSQDDPLAADPQATPVIDTRARPALYEQLRRLMAGKPRARKRAAKALSDSDPTVLIPLVDAYFFAPGQARVEAREVLEAISGQNLGSRYRDWVEYVGSRTDVESPPEYAMWKGELFGRIDRRYREVFSHHTPPLNPSASVPLRLREVQWGGVPWDGIPVINDPEAVPADTARFMRETDTVFGVRIGGEHRAYPVKVLSWHELLNDTVGGQPITLSFCTLCGSGILYSAVDEEGNRLMFGTSGLLYRSNKLMFDRATLSLWSNLTGEAVIGERAAEGARLTMLPMTLTRWNVWRQRHPDTTVMVPEPSEAQRTGYRYVEGAADAARAGVEFPVWRQSDALERNDRVYALLVNGEAKAYPLDKLRAERLVHDTLGDVPIVIVLDEASDAVRAYRRGSLTFRTPEETPLRQLHAEDGTSWWIAEEGLAPDGDGDLLARVPGHVAFWFGWYAFYPETAVY